MAAYILRNIDPELWARVRVRADQDGHSIKWVIVQLLAHYAAHGLHVLRASFPKE